MLRSAATRGRPLAAPLALAALAGGFLGLLALAPGGPRADAAAPQVTAAHQTTERVVVQIKLPARAEKAPDSVLVELVGPEKKVLQSQKVKWPADGSAVVKAEFKALKAPVDQVSVRTTHGRQSQTTPLATVLLVKAHETTLAAPGELQAGARAEMRCAVRGVRSLTDSVPLAASVAVRFVGPDSKVTDLYKGKTGADGVAPVRFVVPDVPPGTYKVQVETRSALGEEKLEKSVTVGSGVKVLLTTDKPLYQPNQTIHLRALALRSHDLQPRAGSPLVFEVEDGKGNKVFKKELTTSPFGIASADFTLADEVNMGEYRLRALLGDHRAEKTVTVKRYVLPKFKTDLKSDKSFYLPKETIKGTLQVDYFFGKPVAGGSVTVKASTFDIAFKEFATWKGKTDRNGHVTFDVKLPDYFVGTPLASGNALVKLDVTVTDTADHAETVTRTYPVSDRSIRVALLPEGGRLVPDVENRIFVAAQYPDGSPAACAVDVWHGREARGAALAKLKTNDAGLAELKITPKRGQFRAGAWGLQNMELLGGTQQRWGQTNLFDLTAEARDARGNTARNVVELTSEPFGENLLLKLDKAIYKAGDRLELDVRTTAGLPTVYVDVVKSRQTMLTRWLDVKAGQAKASLDLPASAFGTLEVHAYQVLITGEVIRDTRVVYVTPAGDLTVKVTADKDTYRPGEEGTIRFEVTDASGRPTAAALGVLIVDEAVYALQEMQPGLEKVFFTLQEELLKPRGQVVFSPREGIDAMILRQAVPAPQQQIAQALLSAASPKPPAAWHVDPAGARVRALAARVPYLAEAIYMVAEYQDTVLERDPKTGKDRFKKDLLTHAVKARYLDKAYLDDGMGGEVTTDSLARLSDGFTPEAFALALTENRLATLVPNLTKLANGEKARWYKDGRWRFPADVLDLAVKHLKSPQKLTKDAWGHELKVVTRRAADPKLGPADYDSVTIASAGPDGKFGTADDIRYRPVEYYALRVHWFLPEAQRTGARPNWQWQARTRRFAQRDLFLGRGGMPMGGVGGGGALPPMAARDDGVQFDRQAEQGAAKGAVKKDGGAPSDGPPRLREYFPETLLWRPALITDDQGHASLKVPLADSITTWRLTASASSRGGMLGSATAPLRVFQDFFVDLDLPVALTQNDEVEFPVAVYNYLKTPQTVTLTLKQESWFALADGGGMTRSVKLEANQVTALKFRIRAAKVGRFPLQVDARGTKLSDAIRRTIEVLPDGQAVEAVYTDQLKGTVKHTVTIPGTAIDGASRLFVKVYPGVHSQLLEGSEAMLGMPHGCFEQTSSIAYPNILVVDYLKKSKQGSPAMLLKAETYLAAGYQRLLTFERPGGGFDWWGSGPPLVWLSAYGLQEFNDMAKVWPVDRGVIDRTRNWLFKQQGADGTWSNIGATHSVSIEKMGDPKLLLTSYVAWSLLDSMPRPAGWQKTDDYKKLKKAIDYVRDHAPKADNAYILALAANALASWDAKDDSTHEALTRLLRKLDKMQERRAEWEAICFPAKGQSISYGRGEFLTVETTAMAVLAMLKNGQFTNSVNKAMTYLIKSKQGGHWGSTQATILALKALVAGLGGSAQKGTTPFVVKVNGKEVAKGEVTEKNADVLQQFDLREHLSPGDNAVSLEVKGETSLMYQVLGRHFVPHDRVAKPKDPILEVDVAYDRTKLSTADLLKAKATVKYNGQVPTYQVIVDLPIPPGFTVDGGDFAELVAAKKVQRFSVTARQVTLYLGDVKAGSTHTFAYSLKPKYPIKAKTPPAVVYEYYTPSHRAVAKGVTVEVSDKKE